MKSRLPDFPVFSIAGDRGLLMTFGKDISPDINCKVRTITMALEKKVLNGINEVIPTYCSVIIIYDPLIITPEELEQNLLSLDQDFSKTNIPVPDVVEIPVCYGGKFGPDIEYVAEYNQLTTEEIIHIHSEQIYPVYMIGFTPGFPFLGGLSEKLYTPRLKTPRTKVPEGSVGIANNQTGIYSIESPGGWQIIGRTPCKLFDPEKTNPFLLKAGDTLKFIPVSPDEFGPLEKKSYD